MGFVVVCFWCLCVCVFLWTDLTFSDLFVCLFFLAGPRHCRVVLPMRSCGWDFVRRRSGALESTYTLTNASVTPSLPPVHAAQCLFPRLSLWPSLFFCDSLLFMQPLMCVCRHRWWRQQWLLTGWRQIDQNITTLDPWTNRGYVRCSATPSWLPAVLVNTKWEEEKIKE